MEKYQNLFNYLAEHFGVHPTVTEMEDIVKQVAIAAANLGLISGITYNKHGGIRISIEDIEELKEW